MKMFCYQCQEAMGNKGCTIQGVCGKSDDAAVLQDLLIYLTKGISILAIEARKSGIKTQEADIFVIEALFSTVTNVNFDAASLEKLIGRALKIRDSLKRADIKNLPDCATWSAGGGMKEYIDKAKTVGVMSEANEDIRSLRELLIYGLKGIAAYADHASILGKKDESIAAFLEEGLASTVGGSLAAGDYVALVLRAGEYAVKTMALLDAAHTSRYGAPEITEVYTGIKEGPGILVSGHDLLDLEEILKQAEGSGANVYTHGEMLPALAYPYFKKQKHLVGNYGTSWYNQQAEFDAFQGPIVMTTNCVQRPRDSYKDRLFTTGLVGWPGVKHIADRRAGGHKDFSRVIDQALVLGEMAERPGKKLTIGFAHGAVLGVADKVIAAIKSGAIKRFVVMAGCDGRHREREYFTKVAKALPKDAVILTAGCAKYRYNMLDLGSIGGIPRVLDAGQCNDSYSLAVVALKLKEVFNLRDVNDLPISFDIGWYEQKAVCVLLALLYLGFKNIRLGPTLPAFLSPNVVNVLVEKFDIKPISTPEADVADMMAANVAA
jgi:hydroxylamine reductase